MTKTITSANLLFTIEESDDKGRILVAMKDILPGTELFVEERPLLFIDKDYLGRFDKMGRVGVFTAAYNTYSRRLSQNVRRKFMQLFGPTEGPFPDSIRVLAQEMMTWDNDEKRTFNEKEVEDFVKVASIWRYNSCTVNSGNTLAVYETASRMSHSCLPNCAMEYAGTRCVCRVILPVKKAEELSVEYNQYHRFRPVHERRHIYLEKKDFTCHCDRCDAMGDDTRRFRCFNAQCAGEHRMHQPLNKEPFPAEGTAYTGVEYREPRLLACSVCGAEASEQQTAAALEQEKQMATFGIELEGTLAESFDRFSEQDCVDALQRIDAALSQPYHALAGPLLRNHWKVSQYLHSHDGKGEQLWSSAERYVRWLNHLYCFPSAQLLRELQEVAAGLLESTWAPALVPARELCLRALRLSLLLRGREDQRMELDRMLAVAHMRLQSPALTSGQNVPPLALPKADPDRYTGAVPTAAPSPSAPVGNGGGDADGEDRGGTTGTLLAADARNRMPSATRCCWFCQESPDRVALVLSRCARCKKALYCGPGCQKAHWKEHKADCTK